jgi:Transmembrane family 220, helix
MTFRLVSLVMAVFFAWAAAMQLNAPDPTRWFLMYASGALMAVLSAVRRATPQLALGLAFVALAWTAAIVPELWPHWTVADLGAQMSVARPEVEYGREFVGLLILAAYCLASTRLAAKPPAAVAVATVRA